MHAKYLAAASVTLTPRPFANTQKITWISTIPRTTASPTTEASIPTVTIKGLSNKERLWPIRPNQLMQVAIKIKGPNSSDNSNTRKIENPVLRNYWWPKMSTKSTNPSQLCPKSIECRRIRARKIARSTCLMKMSPGSLWMTRIWPSKILVSCENSKHLFVKICWIKNWGLIAKIDLNFLFTLTSSIWVEFQKFWMFDWQQCCILNRLPLSKKLVCRNSIESEEI